jgi:GGDEF domain-containing protein
MSVISIKRLLGVEGDKSTPSLRVAQILLRGLGLHAIEGDPEAFQQFRNAMDQSADALGESISDAASLVTVGAALGLLEEYNRRVANYLASGGHDLRAMIKMLTGVIQEFAGLGGENLQRLQHIETRIATAHQAEDVGVIKAQLAACLQEIKKEAERQKSATAAAVDRLQEDLRRAQTESIDPATGLRPRAKAVEFLNQTCASHLPAVAVCMVLDRLQTVNLSFGSAVGDQMLLYFADFVRRNLPAQDQLFRWTGASLMAIVPQADQLKPVRLQFSRLFDHKLEFSVQTSSRGVLLPVNARWTVFALTPDPAAVIQQIDAFASLAGGQPA